MSGVARQRILLAVRLAGWVLLTLALLAACAVAAWLAVSAAHGAVSAAPFPAVTLLDLAGTLAFFGWLPLLFLVPLLAALAGWSGRFRPRAVAASAVLGSGLGLIAVYGRDRPQVHASLATWVLFGLLVPRPPVTPGGGDRPGDQPRDGDREVAAGRA